MSNLQTEIDSILDSLVMKPDFRGRTKKEPGVTKSGTIKIFGKKQAKAQLLELFDKSVEEVISTGEHDDFQKTVTGKKSFNSRKLRAEQRQTWNKIKGGEV